MHRPSRTDRIPRLTHALVRDVSPTMADGLTTQSLGRPDLARAVAEHAAYVAALEAEGLSVRRLPALPELPDAHFVEDTAVVHRGVAILTRPGAPARRAEVDRVRPYLESELEVRELGGGPDATLDGGDVLFAGRNVLVGVAHRTNAAGARALAARLAEVDPELRVRTVPFAGVLHLKSAFTALGPDEFVADPKAELPSDLPGEVHWLPPAEGFAANVLPVNGARFVLAGSPVVRALAERASPRVVTVDLGEFRKMDGSLTCLSLVW